VFWSGAWVCGHTISPCYCFLCVVNTEQWCFFIIDVQTLFSVDAQLHVTTMMSLINVITSIQRGNECLKALAGPAHSSKHLDPGDVRMCCYSLWLFPFFSSVLLLFSLSLFLSPFLLFYIFKVLLS